MSYVDVHVKSGSSSASPVDSPSIVPGSASSVARIRPSPGELQTLLEEEKAWRRKRRLQQTRQRSAEVAKEVRLRVKKEKWEQIKKVSLEELERYRQAKEVELACLEEEYQTCLKDIGIGHEGAREAEKYAEFVKKQREVDQLRAEARGAEALRRQRKKDTLLEKVKENKLEMRRSAILAEKLRAAKVRASAIPKAKIDLIEINEEAARRVTTVERKELISAVPESGKEEYVRRIPLRDIGNNGLEAAISELEHIQREARVKRQQQMAEGAFPKSPSTTSSSPSGNRLLSTIDEETEPTTHRTPRDVDTIPVRERTVASVPQPRSRTAQAELPESQTSSDLEEIRNLLDRVDMQWKQLDAKEDTVKGSGSGQKNQEEDSKFVAKVLGVSPHELTTSLRDGVAKTHVRINVEEISLESEESSVSVKHTNSSTSSSSMARELSLIQPLRPPDGIPTYQAIYGLIQKLRTPASSETSPATSDSSLQRSTTLRLFIEKLLSMRRQEIVDLSVTDTATFSGSSPSSFVASTPASILSSSDSRSSSQSKTVRFKDELDGSLTMHLRPMTDNVDYIRQRKAVIEMQTKASLKEIRRTFEQKKREIEEALKKRISLKTKRVETTILHMTPSLTSSSSTSVAISEGLLSDSVSVAQETVQEAELHSETSKSSTSVRTESSPNEEYPAEVTEMLESLKLNWAQSMLRRMQEEIRKDKLNKSSSSGSSGSAAIAELKQRLTTIEMPKLAYPNGQMPPQKGSYGQQPGREGMPSAELQLSSTTATGITEEQITLVSLSDDSDDEETRD